LSRLFTALLALLLSATAVTAYGAPRLTAVDKFAPTQVGVGRASAMVHLDDWKAAAKRKDMSLKKYAKKILQRELDEHAVPVVIDPQGRIRNTDAHHHITALLELQKQTGYAVKLRTKVLKDYRGYTEAAYAKDFIHTLDKGWFARSVRDRSDLVKIESLPDRYSQLKNDPMRSVVDTAFEKLGLDGKMFTDYVEFRVGEALLERGLMVRLRDKGLVAKGARSIPDRDVFDKKIVKQVIKQLRKPEMRALLLDNARTKTSAKQIGDALDD
jgi:hypothetical protein